MFTYTLKQTSKIVYAACLLAMSMGVIGALLKVQYNFSVVSVLFGNQTFASKIQENQGKQVALALDSYFPSGTAVMVYDCPGVIAYYSSLKIVPVDGLVNDYAYNEELKERGIQEFCQKHGIEHFLGPELSRGMLSKQETLKGGCYQGKQVFHFHAPLDLSHCGTMIFDQSQQIMRLPDPVRHMDSEPHYVGLWKLSGGNELEKEIPFQP